MSSVTYQKLSGMSSSRRKETLGRDYFGTPQETGQPRTDSIIVVFVFGTQIFPFSRNYDIS